MNAGGLYGNARPENFPNVNDYRNPLVASAMKTMGYVNMFNRGVGQVQTDLKENKNKPALFDVSLITAFKVNVFSTFDITQGDTQNDTQGDTQGGTQDVPQEIELDVWIEDQIRKNSKVSTEELAKLSNRGVATIKRHISKLPHIKYIGSGYSGHWEIDETMIKRK